MHSFHPSFVLKKSTLKKFAKSCLIPLKSICAQTFRYRAGAKNFKDVVIVPSKAEYSVLLDILKKKGAETDIEDRKMFAERAFGVSSHYDTAIHAWFAK